MRILIITWLMLVFFEGKVSAQSTFVYRPITVEEIKAVRNIWVNRDLDARAVEVVYEEVKEGRKLLVVKHNVMSRTHFGIVVLPDLEDLSSTPVVVLPDGLNQSYPAIDVEMIFGKYLSFEQLKGLIMIVPAFRGRALNYKDKDKSWFSDGDFCDAYDGAADDSIATLNVVEKLFPEANFEKVLVWGDSRGGNTALLMAIRDPRVSTVIANAAPVNFYRDDLRLEYGEQYECQFFRGKTQQESREHIIASSPLYFEPQKNLENVYLHHSEVDEIVPAWNPKEMAAHLQDFSVSATAFIYPVEGHGAYLGEEKFWDNLFDEIDHFINSIE